MLKVGDVIGKYKITKELNNGEFCNSFFVTGPDGSFFLKEYTDPKQTDPIFQAFYDNQCTIIDRLNKMASIAEKYVDHFIENGIYYQVKVKLHGVDLDTYISTPRDYEPLKQLCIILCGVIKNLHSQGIVHQDLKPSQIMLVDDDLGKKTKLGYRVVLSDFDWSIPDGKVVQIVGTPYYKSPEHYLNEVPTFESDNFTIGVILYQLLAGHMPFDFGDVVDEDEIKSRVLKGKIYSPPRKLNKDINEEVSGMILRCMDPKPVNRPKIEEIQTTLLGAAATSPAAKPGGSAPSAPSRFSIASADHKMIIFSSKEIGRNEIKIFFSDLTDKGGISLHKYCDEGQSMLAITKEPDGTFSISAPNTTKNYFLLNSVRIIKEKIKLSIGDKLDLFSTAKGEIVGNFSIQA